MSHRNPGAGARRRFTAALAAFALATTGALVAITPAASTDRADGTERAELRSRVSPDVRGRELLDRGKVAESLKHASGPVTAFVQLDAPSALDLFQAKRSRSEIRAQAAAIERLADQVVPEVATEATVDDPEPQQLSVTSNLVAGVVVTGDADEVRALAQEDDVVAVYRIIPKEPSNKGADAFTRALDTWVSTGLTGEGVSIGIIDTGVDYTHAAFGGPGTAEAYAEAYGTDGTGPVPAGSFDPAKFAGGFDFAGPTYNASSSSPSYNPIPAPDDNPIDAPFSGPNSGHGTHVAGTAAGYGVTPEGTTFDGDYSTLTDLSDWIVGPGSAPLAQVYGLKVFGDNGGSTALVIDALEWAADPDGDGDFNDHLDIVNLSLGSDHSLADDPENLFIDQLTNLGVLSVIASGNGGDMQDIGGSPGNARSALTVANSVGDAVSLDAIEIVEVPSDPSLVGTYGGQNSVFYEGEDDVTAEVAYLGATVDGCTSLEEYAEEVDGKIVYLYWDDINLQCGSAVRWNNVEAAGGAGVLLSSNIPVFTAGIAGNATIPGAQLTQAATDMLLPAIEAGGVVAHIGPSLANAGFEVNPDIGDLLNSGSSRGVHGSLGIVKPDVAAPGTLISSAAAGAGTGPGTLSGTSMATPHVAGIAALVREAHPGFDVPQVKAAVVNTATHDLWTGQGQTGVRYGPNRVGAGRVDALAAVSTDAIAFNTQDAAGVSVTFGVVNVGTATVTDQRTVTVRNTGSSAQTFATSVDLVTSSGGASITAAPASVTVPAGQTRTVTLTFTADPATLVKELDPTMDPAPIGVPRDFLTAVSGRLVLTPESGSPLRVPVHAAPRLVSDMSAAPVDLAGLESAPLSLSGSPALGGGWVSVVAPFELVAESPKLETTTAVTSPSAIASGDIRYVGFASTAPQLAAAGEDPADATIGIGIAVDGEWTSLGSVVIPVIDIDIDGDGIWDLETVVWKFDPEQDVTTAETYELIHDPVTDSYSFGDLLDLWPVNTAFGNLDTSVFDNNTLIAPIGASWVGIEPGHTPTFLVGTWSPYAEDPSGIIDEAEPFTVDPFTPNYWFDDGFGETLIYPDLPGEDISVYRAEAAPEEGKLLLLHLHNGLTTTRPQVVDVSAGELAPEPTPTPTKPPEKATSTTSLKLSPAKAKYGSKVKATVTVRAASGSPSGKVTISRGGKKLAWANLKGNGTKRTASVWLPRNTPVGKHTITASYAGNAKVKASSGTAKLTVSKAKAKVKTSSSSGKVKGATVQRLKVGVATAKGAPTARGTVTATVGKKSVRATLSRGSAKLTLPKLRTATRVKVTYRPAKNTYAKASTTIVVKPRR